MAGLWENRLLSIEDEIQVITRNAIAWTKAKQRHFLISVSSCSMGNPYMPEFSA